MAAMILCEPQLLLSHRQRPEIVFNPYNRSLDRAAICHLDTHRLTLAHSSGETPLMNTPPIQQAPIITAIHLPYDLLASLIDLIDCGDFRDDNSAHQMITDRTEFDFIFTREMMSSSLSASGTWRVKVSSR
jgi:hypothetical protein